MDTVTNKLQTGKTKVQELEEKVKTLEENLSKNKNRKYERPLRFIDKKPLNDEVKKIECL